MPAKRYFEFSEGTSNKFWEVWRDGVQVFTRYGKIGANGQVTVKKLSSDADAKSLHDKLIGEKTGKGYAEAGGKKTAKAAGKSNGQTGGSPDLIVVPAGGYRLEVIDGKSSKFWEGTRTDKTVTVTFGKIGTPGTTQKKKYKEEWEARHDLSKQLEEKKRKGYQFVTAGPRLTAAPSATNPQLEQSIAKDPASEDGYMVYADWLMQQNDLRGELAALQARLAKSPKDKKLKNAETKLLADNRSYFFGPWAVYIPKKVERGNNTAIAATWRQGWIDSLRLSAVTTGWNEEAPTIPVSDCGELVRLIPKAASARLVRELTIGCPVSEDEFNFHATVKELVKVLPQMPVLRRVTLGEFDMEDSELSWSYLGSLKDLWPVASKLEYLKIHAGSMDLAKIHAPELRELRIETGGFSKKNLASILDANMPKLETLNIWFGQDNYGCNVKPKDLAPLLDGKKFPKLKHLGIANTTWANDLVPMLVGAKVLKQLESLDLSKSHLTLVGIRAMAASVAAFKHLASLDLSECLLSKEAQKLAKTLAKNVDISQQENESEFRPEEGEEDEDWWRYSAVGE
jgi:uncharacterized protein (TIGR02996 family)